MNTKPLIEITPEIAKRAKARVDTFTGSVAFQWEGVHFFVFTRKGVKHARMLLLKPELVGFSGSLSIGLPEHVA